MKKKKNKVSRILKNGRTDPMGSYTGVVTGKDGKPVPEKPVQDADDL